MKIAIHAHIHTPSKPHKCPDQRVETHCNGFLPPSVSRTIALHRISHHVGGVSPLAMRGMPAIRLRRAAVLIFTHSVTSDTTNATAAAATRAVCVCVPGVRACTHAHARPDFPVGLCIARPTVRQTNRAARSRARVSHASHTSSHLGSGVCMHLCVRCGAPARASRPADPTTSCRWGAKRFGRFARNRASACTAERSLLCESPSPCCPCR